MMMIRVFCKDLTKGADFRGDSVGNSPFLSFERLHVYDRSPDGFDIHSEY